jgi:hypothetical protein
MSTAAEFVEKVGWMPCLGRAGALLKKAKKQIPFGKLRAGSPGLKPARDDKIEELIGMTEVVPSHKAFESGLFQRPV